MSNNEQSFVHLSVFSEYSIIKGMVKLPELMARLSELKMSSVALTDYCNFFAAIKFFNLARKHNIKPIFGCQALIKYHEDAPATQVFFWCKNYRGYQNLSYLLSQAYLNIDEQQTSPVINLIDVSAKYLKDLIVGIGGYGCVLRKDSSNKFDYINFWKNLSQQLVFCVADLGFEQDNIHNIQILRLAEKFKTPAVAVNDVCFLQQDDFNAHEARLCIERSCVLDDPSRKKDISSQQFLKSAEQMYSLFEKWPEILKNTNSIAKSCNVWFDCSQHFLPNFPIPENQKLDFFFRNTAKIGLQEKFDVLCLSQNQQENYMQRLDMECDVIISMGFCGYFLIVADFINWSKHHKIAVGPGRGSGAGSLVAFALGITGIDPIPYGLLFERFLNPERVSMPDFDIDFCMIGRDRVIEYVADKYGHNNVSQIITFGTLAARAVVRDVGRVLSFPYGFVDKLAKLIPNDLGMTLTKALDKEPLLAQRYREENDVTVLLDLALRLEGVVRGVGRHAGGVVIAPSELYNFTPIYCDGVSESIISQFDKDDIETIGLVKFDFLGLRTLTIIDWSVKLIKQRHQKDFNIDLLPLNDVKTFKLLQNCETTAVFQLESRGMKDLIRRLKPDSFEEIVALVALFRPGPLQAGMVDDFIERKHGRQSVSYLHPSLKEILEPTNGIILYQEQVMQIAQVLSSYTLGGADLLRRAMGKKKPEEMAKQRSVFVNGAVKNGHDQKVASKIFDLIEKFAGYGFNKSHSVAYAMISYQTAWLKSHYPAEFMASALSSDLDNTDKILIMLQSCEAMGLNVLMPDINKSEYKFTVVDDLTICYGLGAIKGMGESFTNCLVENRNEKGKFVDLLDLANRLSKYKINRKILECLIKSGAVDDIVPCRNTAYCSIDNILTQACQMNKDSELGQISLFDQLQEQKTIEFKYKSVTAWSNIEKLREERSVLGLYLSGHPLTSLRVVLNDAKALKIASLKENSKVFIAGLVTSCRVIQGKRGQSMAFVNIEDETSSIDAALFGDTYHSFRSFLIKDQIVVLRGLISVDSFNNNLRLQVEWMQSFEDFLSEKVKNCYVYFENVSSNLIDNIKKVVTEAEAGCCNIIMCYESDNKKTKIQAGKDYSIIIDETVLTKLQNIDGVTNTRLEFFS